jgi:hypothetical protein
LTSNEAAEAGVKISPIISNTGPAHTTAARPGQVGLGQPHRPVLLLALQQGAPDNRLTQQT